jgi:hypothetical protein
MRVCSLLFCYILTDDGAFGRPVKGVVDGGRKESVFDALCKGNEGVADLDISHALGQNDKDNWIDV